MPLALAIELVLHLGISVHIVVAQHIHQVHHHQVGIVALLLIIIVAEDGLVVSSRAAVEQREIEGTGRDEFVVGNLSVLLGVGRLRHSLGDVVPRPSGEGGVAEMVSGIAAVGALVALSAEGAVGILHRVGGLHVVHGSAGRHGARGRTACIQFEVDAGRLLEVEVEFHHAVNTVVLAVVSLEGDAGVGVLGDVKLEGLPSVHGLLGIERAGLLAERVYRHEGRLRCRHVGFYHRTRDPVLALVYFAPYHLFETFCILVKFRLRAGDVSVRSACRQQCAGTCDGE